MPMFYLHVCNGEGFAEDDEGSELPDLQAARARAITGLRDIMSSEMKQGLVNMASFIEIEDENHRLLATVEAQEAVTLRKERKGSPRRS